MKHVKNYLSDPPAWVAVVMLVVLAASIAVQFARHGVAYESVDSAMQLLVTALWVGAAEMYRYSLKKQRSRAALLELQRNALMDVIAHNATKTAKDGE